MNKSVWIIGAIALLLGSGSAWGQQEGHGVRTLRGRVVDTEGRPVAGVLVGPQIGMYDQAADPEGAPTLEIQSVETDAQGRFTIERAFHGEPVGLIARRQASKQGGYAIIAPKDADQPIEIKLDTLIRLHGRICFQDDVGRQIGLSSAVLTIGNGHARYGYVQSSHGRFEILLPAGDYSMYVGGDSADYDSVTRQVAIKASQGDVDLGTIGLPVKAIVKLKGKPAPQLQIVDARGAPKTAQVADYKGKWVLLYFWGFW